MRTSGLVWIPFPATPCDTKGTVEKFDDKPVACFLLCGPVATVVYSQTKQLQTFGMAAEFSVWRGVVGNQTHP
jgi:hypothetical protein